MLLDDFFIRSIIAGIGIALIAGPLGCFVVWRRMSYLGDTMAHSSLLGVALGFLLGIDPLFGVFAVAVLMALLLFFFQKQKQIASDAILGTLSHASLALGILVVSLMTWVRIDISSFLFGDILSVEISDIGWIYGGGLIVLAVFLKNWKSLLAITVDEDLAKAEGIPVVRVHLIYLFLIAAVIALAIKIIGVLLVTSLLIVPATAARRYSNTPEQMAIGAALLGVVSVVLGLLASLEFDVPSGPAIVIVVVSFFFSSFLLPASFNSRAG
ncbi:MAG: metal ABC transporter permease [Gammaproteobacteria bacterium]|nr:metal ABC transporter permease [Gammaproteobacteria bacterium]